MLMIKETKKKIKFLEFRPSGGRPNNKSGTPTTTLFSERGTLQFNRYAVDQMKMSGSFVRFFYEPAKRVIGWQVSTTYDERNPKLWKKCKTHKNGMWVVAIKKLLDRFTVGNKALATVYRDMPVMKYTEQKQAVGGGVYTSTFYYVELSDEYAEIKKNV